MTITGKTHGEQSLSKAPQSHFPSEAYSGLSNGGVAQLAERYVRNVEVGGSNPLTSTEVWGIGG